MSKSRRTATRSGNDYFVTGGTGFIGRFLIERLLARPETKIHALVRTRSRRRFAERLAQWKTDSDRVVPVTGDLGAPHLGLGPKDFERLRDRVGHFIHVAGLYDMTASEEALESVNVAGTRNAVRAAERMGARSFQHVSSIAAAGRYPGTFRESMFAEARGLDDPYFRTKHSSEGIVRESCSVPWRIYRPSLVVGHSVTGEIDKIDGPYYLFPLLDRLAAALPAFLRLPGIEGGYVNLVPVDFVAAAIDHIAHLEGRDGKAFHLVDPHNRSVGQTIDLFAAAAGAPHFSLRLPGIESAASPLMRVVARRADGLAGTVIAQALGVPPRALDYLDNRTVFDCRNTTAALRGSGIEVPPLESYAPRLWQYWERNFNVDTGHSRSIDRAVRGKTVLITGASSGIGRATALKLGAAGARLILVARNAERLDEVRALIERSGGKASVLPADLTDAESADALCHRITEQFGGVDVLINCAGRSIRRSLQISEDRFHDFERTMQINYFGALRLILGLLPAMRKRQSGHIINVSSIGAQIGPPRFSAYIASKAALDGFSKCAAPELLGQGIDITSVYMPLVKTEMTAPTGLYDSFVALTPAQAADLICSAVVRRPKRISTALGLAGQITSGVAPNLFDFGLHVAYRLFPDSAAARGETHNRKEHLSSLAKVFARLFPGVHW